MPYVKDPLIVKNLFDDTAFQTIQRFMEDWLPLTRLDSDRREPDPTKKFGRRYGHNVGFFRDLHHQLTDYATEIFGQEVKPSYSFLSLYDDGGQCPLHLDRPQCRYTIDYLIRQDDDNPWPINIGPQMSNREVKRVKLLHPETDDDRATIIKNTNWTTCNLEPNDAVCYSGTNAWHYRPTRSRGSVDLVFWHFVPRSFRGSLA